MMSVRPSHLPSEDPEDTSFTMTTRNEFLRGALDSLKNSVVVLLWRSVISVVTAIAKLQSLDAVG